MIMFLTEEVIGEMMDIISMVDQQVDDEVHTVADD